MATFTAGDSGLLSISSSAFGIGFFPIFVQVPPDRVSVLDSRLHGVRCSGWVQSSGFGVGGDSGLVSINSPAFGTGFFPVVVQVPPDRFSGLNFRLHGVWCRV